MEYHQKEETYWGFIRLITYVGIIGFSIFFWYWFITAMLYIF